MAFLLDDRRAYPGRAVEINARGRAFEVSQCAAISRLRRARVKIYTVAPTGERTRVTELFRSENLLVRQVAQGDIARWVVTFDNYELGRTLDRAGFGEHFFASRGISAIHVVSAGNHWYQYAEMAAATAAIRAATKGAERIVAYGSSMGGYAAIRFGDAVGADQILAVSPQYSIDPAKMPSERRWPQEAASIAWLPDVDGTIACRTVPVVVFDPTGTDGEHARRIAADIVIEPIAIPYIGHPATTYMSEQALLEPMLVAMLAGTLDVATSRQTILARRKRSAIYLGELAQRQPASRSRTAIALARRGLAVAPDTPFLHHALARLLTQRGAHHEALPLHRQAVDGSERHLGYLYPYSEALLAAGDLEEALSTAREMVDRDPKSAVLHCWLGNVRWQMSDKVGAIASLETTVRLDPTNRYYRHRLAEYSGNTRRLRWRGAASLSFARLKARLRSLVTAR